MTETWKPIPDFPDYEISDQGRIKSLKMKKPRILRLYTCKRRGYKIASLRKNGKTLQREVGLLVMLAFIGPPPDGHKCWHINRDRSDNRLTNLEYTLHGNPIRQSGKRLNEKDIIQIRQQRKSGMSTRSIAEAHNITEHVVSDICCGKVYQWCSGPIVKPREILVHPPHTRKLSPSDAIDIYHRVKNGEMKADIARELGVDAAIITRICNGTRKATKHLVEAERNST